MRGISMGHTGLHKHGPWANIQTCKDLVFYVWYEYGIRIQDNMNFTGFGLNLNFGFMKILCTPKQPLMYVLIPLSRNMHTW